MKISTRQYAKRQVSWIRNKLLPAAFATNNVARQDAEKGREVVPAYLLDATRQLHRHVYSFRSRGLNISFCT